MKLSNILLIIAFVAIVLVLAFIPRQRHYNWDIDQYPTASGVEPYDMDLFDNLMAKSLPLGYKAETAPIAYKFMYSYKDEYLSLNRIAEAPSDTSLLIIQYYNWERPYSPDDDEEDYSAADDDEEEYEYEVVEVVSVPNKDIRIINDLMQFAKRGGTALYVELGKYPLRESLNNILNELGIPYQREYVTGNYYSKPLSLSDLRNRPNYPLKLLREDGNTIDIDDRYNYFSYSISPSAFENYNRYRTPAQPVVSPLLANKGNISEIFGLDFYFPKSGGHLYYTTLGVYFTNFGVTIDGSEDIYTYLVGPLSDTPVVRLQYPPGVYNPPRGNNAFSVLNVIQSNEALWTAWTLMLVMVALLLANGLVRRHPVAKGAQADTLDKTDAMAVREYEFHKSPLLQFLFQTSWLFNSNSDYSKLYEINFRRVARSVNRLTGIELVSADDHDIKLASEILASRQGRSAQEIADELHWMIDNRTDSISPKKFSISQEIAERLAVSD